MPCQADGSNAGSGSGYDKGTPVGCNVGFLEDMHWVNKLRAWKKATGSIASQDRRLRTTDKESQI
eukprot:2373430-Ditylum_brightwellii.AAC.1